MMRLQRQKFFSERAENHPRYEEALGYTALGLGGAGILGGTLAERVGRMPSSNIYSKHGRHLRIGGIVAATAGAGLVGHAHLKRRKERKNNDNTENKK